MLDICIYKNTTKYAGTNVLYYKYLYNITNVAMSTKSEITESDWTKMKIPCNFLKPITSCNDNFFFNYNKIAVTTVS